jgi:isocitrate lyase
VVQELGELGYAFQFVTLAGFHSLNHGMFELAQGYSKRGMAAYAELQQVCLLHQSRALAHTMCLIHCDSFLWGAHKGFSFGVS